MDALFSPFYADFPSLGSSPSSQADVQERLEAERRGIAAKMRAG
jgi:hypothetical protein